MGNSYFFVNETSIAHDESIIGNINKNELDSRGTAASSVLVKMSGKSPHPPSYLPFEISDNVLRNGKHPNVR